jgi:hypothetical protein
MDIDQLAGCASLDDVGPGEGVGIDDAVNETGAFELMVFGLQPGPSTMALLASIDPAVLDPYDRLCLLQAWERQNAWLMAQQQVAMIGLIGPGPKLDSDWVREEVACGLRISGDAAGHRMHVARVLHRQLPATTAALAAGQLLWQHAKAIVDACAELDPELSALVEQRVLARAGDQSVGQLRNSLRRAVIAVAPVAAEQRRAKAAATRDVQLFPMGDGLTSFCALLPAPDAQAVFEAIDARARATAGVLDECGNKLGIAARRADALVALVTGVGVGGGRVAGHPVELQVVIDLPTLLGLRDNPAELVGYGAITGKLARELGRDASWRRLVADPVSGSLLDYGRSTYRPPRALREFVEARDRTCRFPFCRQPAKHCDIDHAQAWEAGGQTSAENCGCLCRRHHRMKTLRLWRLVARPDGSVTWTSPTKHTYEVRPPPPLGAD